MKEIKMSDQEVTAKFWETVGKVYEAVSAYKELIKDLPEEKKICTDEIYSTVDQLLEPQGSAIACDVVLPRLLTRWGTMTVGEKCEFMGRLGWR